jgi:hypothetical protein
MSTAQNLESAYGLTQALINVFPYPILSKRAPTASDKAQLGTLWVNSASNAVYILASIKANIATWIDVNGGSGSFTNLTVSGTSTFGGTATFTGTAGIHISGTGSIAVDNGNISATNGTVSAAQVTTTLGISAGTTLIAGTGIVSTTGNITASGSSGTFIASGTSGGFSAPLSGITVGTISGGFVTAATGNMQATAGGFIAGGSSTPTAGTGQVAYGSNPNLTNAGTGTFVITGTSGAGDTKNSGFLQVNIAGTNYYIPVFPSVT